MSAEAPRSVRSSGIRFIVAGGLNTLVTGVALSVLAHFINPRIAYTIVFVLGIAIAVALAGGFVFGVRMTRRLTVLYIAMYLAVYLVGLGVVSVAERAGMPASWSGLVVLVTAPLTFIGGRLLLVGPTSRTRGD